ncbi:hypothetical protein [Limosilactobacillus mucosae]|uniref:hypothetical protein n=1 Tax=Limosilactobacillus mucosae TaxID=97478 RepID=UPI0002503EBE|nr:hypothetical protein [Limosilactobacillus mucosae]
MFSKELRTEAQENLENKISKYESVAKKTKRNINSLYLERTKLKKRLDNSMTLINKFRNTPQEINFRVSKIKINMNRYQGILDAAEEQYKNDVTTAGGTAAAGLATGVGVAALAPSAAMAIATTFGTASTGAAISTLSGAAATNAALAWLGGGSLAAGGAGIVGGETLLSLAGPIGWAIGGVGLATGGLIANGKNKKAAEEMNRKAAKVQAEIRKQQAVNFEIRKMITLTRNDTNDLANRVRQISKFSKDYSTLDNQKKQLLITFVNNVQASSEHLNMVLGRNRKFIKGNSGVRREKSKEK